MLMNKTRILGRLPGADNTLLCYVSVKEKLPPFLGLQDVTVFVSKKANIPDVFGMNKNADTWKGYGCPVLQFAPSTHET